MLSECFIIFSSGDVSNDGEGYDDDDDYDEDNEDKEDNDEDDADDGGEPESSILIYDMVSHENVRRIRGKSFGFAVYFKVSYFQQ